MAYMASKIMHELCKHKNLDKFGPRISVFAQFMHDFTIHIAQQSLYSELYGFSPFNYIS